MEHVILKSLAFDLAVPTALSFLERYEKSVNLPQRLAEKLCHLTKASWSEIIFTLLPNSTHVAQK